MASTKYNSEDPSHEQKLMDLWKCLKETPIEKRQCPMWMQLGFQGSDPATDFRGMGILALDQLL